MALEAVVYSQDPFSTYGYKDFYSIEESSWDLGLHEQEDQNKALLGILDQNIEQEVFPAKWESSSPSVIQHAKQWEPNSSSPDTVDQFPTESALPPMESGALPTTGRRKRRRTRSCKNKEELENQRMTHIAVERNRRKQMNEYLAVLRSLMPPSYVQRGDQASIIGGAINFVKKLEQLLQSMEVQKQIKQQPQESGSCPSPFAEFFTLPQFSTRTTQNGNSSSSTVNEGNMVNKQQMAAVADIEVTMVDSHANIKILSKRRPRQLLKMVAGIQCLKLGVQHLNVNSVDQMVLYSVSVKVEEGSQLHSVDEIASAINQMMCRIEEESALS